MTDKPTLDDLMSQATVMANQGGPGKNSAAADTWLQTQAAKWGYTQNTGTDYLGAAIGMIGGPLGIGPAAAPLVEGAAQSTGSAAGDWLQSHAANYGLVIMGALLAIGALLISQRNNVINIGKVAAEVAA